MKKSKKIKSVTTRLVNKYIITLFIAAPLNLIVTGYIYVQFIPFFVSFVRNYISQRVAQFLNDYYEGIFLFVTTAVFILIALIITIVFFIKSARLTDTCYDSIENIVYDNYQTPALPRELKQVHLQAESKIKNALKQRDYLLQASEQRKNDLVVYLAHDLKTPLTSIVGYLTLLQEAPEMPAEYRAKYTQITLDKAYRLEQLINEFFDITRFNLQSVILESNHLELTMMLNQMAEEFYPILAQKDLTCSINANEKINLIGDADKLSRVFDNLMRNAVSYSYPNTEIEISAYKSDNHAVILFKNHGDKIPAEKLKMIFEKFFRADESRTSSTGGAGLGLAIAKQIVEKHGGTISAQSDSNSTVFTVKLPLQQNVIKS